MLIPKDDSEQLINHLILTFSKMINLLDVEFDRGIRVFSISIK